MKKINIIFSIIFLTIIFLPIFDNIFNFSPIKILFENREVAPFPDLPKNFEKLKSYPINFEKFYNDNYGFRKTLISINYYLSDNIFDISPDIRAIRGLDGWLYFNNQNSILDAQGFAKIDDEKIDKLAKNLYQNYKISKAKNIEYLFIIAADKSSIYPEFLPKIISDKCDGSAKNSNYDNCKNSKHRIDFLIEKLNKNYPDFPVLDLRKILNIAKKNHIIYHQTDTHWNDIGAFYGYLEISKYFQNFFQSLSLKDFEIDDSKKYKGDISDILNSDEENIDYILTPKFSRKYFEKERGELKSQGFYEPIIFENYNKNLPILFVYKDSFFDNLMQFFSNHFYKSYFINESPCEIDFEKIKKFKPNILIQEFWEGRIEEVADKCH